MRKRLYEIIEVSKENDIASRIYDWLMMLTIFISIVPLAFTEEISAFDIIDKVTVVIFIVDYIFRLITADYKLGKSTKSFVIYPFTPMAIVDIVSILPSLTILNNGFRLLKILRFLRTLRVLKVFKAVRYSKNIQIIINVFKKQANALIMVGLLAIGYILVTALIVLNIEPETFENYFRALYWATISLTTMGYGDIYPVSAAGQVMTMISSLFGIAIVALPAGIVTAGYMEEVHSSDESMRTKRGDINESSEEKNS